jgi:RNA-directed DNA polymerase
LKLSDEKTTVVHISGGFNFLGWNFRRFPNGKYFTRPSKESLKSVMGKVKSIISKEGMAMSQDELIRTLNPVLRGWSSYHRSVVASRTFRVLNQYVFTTLWRWAVRRHNNKGYYWVKNRYWHRRGTRNWVFCTKENTLFHVSDVKIRRHIKVRNTMNPYIDRKYFEERQLLKGIKLERGVRDKNIAM